MTKYPLVRLVLGLALGFLGAFVTIEAIDRYGSNERVNVADEVDVGEPDMLAYCGLFGPSYRPQQIATDALGWRCGGFVDGLWAPEDIDFDLLCAWQYGDGTSGRLIDRNDEEGWRCITTG